MSEKRVPPKIQKFPAAKQRRMDALLEKNSEGTITARERASLEKLVEEAESLAITNGKRLARFSEQSAAPANSIPVTVWISPASVSR
jgi:hypothetical protein